VRAEMHLLVRAIAARDWEEAAASIRQDPEDPEGPWDEARFEAALAPFHESYGDPLFTPEARRHQWTHLKETGERTWEATQTLLDRDGDNLWALYAKIDLTDPEAVDGPILTLTRIGP